jgi:hypothetical protein
MATLRKFSDDSAGHEYDVFEEFGDGSKLWRALVVGLADAELKLQELARGSTNNFFAVCLQDRDQPVVRPLKSRAANNTSL